MAKNARFGADLKSGDPVIVRHLGQEYRKIVDYTSPFDAPCLGTGRMYVYFQDGTSLQPDDGATYEVRL